MKLIIVLATIAAPVWAGSPDVVAIENCTIHDSIDQMIVCDVTNKSDTAIAAISYSLLFTQEGRAVPWVDTRDKRHGSISIDGGVEPGETIRHWLLTPPISDRADIPAMRLSVIPSEVIGADGKPFK